MATDQLIADHAFRAMPGEPNACGHVPDLLMGKCYMPPEKHERRDAVIQAQPARITIERPGGSPIEMMLEQMNHFCPGCLLLFAKDLPNLTMAETPPAMKDAVPGGWQAFRAHLQQCIAENPHVFNKGGADGAANN